jgi:DNA-binding transcriptional MerR regulator
MRRLITSGELAKELGISSRTVARYAREGWITPAETTIGGHYRWVLEDVRAEIKKLRERGS